MVLIYLSLYTGSLLNYFLNKRLILLHILWYFSGISLSLTKKFISLLLLSKYLEYPFIWGSFIHNGAGKTLPLCIYSIKYLNELYYYLILYQVILFFNIYFIIINWYLICMKGIFTKLKAFCFIFVQCKEKSQKLFMLIF